MCRTKYFADLSLTKLYSFAAPSCPCSQFQAWFDPSFSFFESKLTENFELVYCYANSFPSIFGGSICCYSANR